MRPYGWKADRIHTEPDEAKVLRRCADLVIAGTSLRSVAAQMEADGIKGPTGKPLQATVISRALLNPRICGKREKRGRLYPADAEPIVTTDKYARIRRVLETPPRPTKIHLLAGGIAECAECENPLYVSKQSGGAYAYSCSVRSGGCGGVWISSLLFEEYVTNEIVRYSSELVPDLTAARLVLRWAGMSPARRREIAEKLITHVSVFKSVKDARSGFDPGRVTVEWAGFKRKSDVASIWESDQ